MNLKLFSNALRYFGLGIIGIFGVLSIISSGGGGGGSDTPTPPPPSSNTISGIAIKGPINGGAVTAFALDGNGNKGNQLGAATTTSDGSFSIDIGNYTGNVIVEVTGGTYTDEATNTPNVSNDATLRVVLVNVTGNVSAQATPLTEIATQIAEDAGGLTSTNVLSALALVSNLIGGADIIATEPADVLDSGADTASTAEQVYGLMLASISQMVQDGKAVDVAAAIRAITSDLANDNTLNTTGGDLATALTNFSSGGNNQTSGQSVDQLDALVTAYTNSSISDTGFSMDDLAGTWNYVGLATPTSDGMSTTYFVDAGYTEIQNSGSYTSTCLFDSNAACGSPKSGSGFTINANGFIPATGLEPGESNYGYMSAGKNLVATIVNYPQEWQRISIALKRAGSYTVADLEGRWISLHLRSPLAGGSINDHGFEVETLDFDNAGTVTVSCIASSDVCFTPQTISGFSISGDGLVTEPGLGQGETSIGALSADKNVVANIRHGPDEQKVVIALKQAASYTMADLAGTWVALSFQSPTKDTAIGMTDIGTHGYGVGSFLVKDNGHITFVCTESSDGCGSPVNGTGFHILSDGTIEPPYGPVPPQPGDESEYWAMSASKNVMADLFIQHGEEIQSLTVFLKLGGGESGASVDFTEYIPVDSQNICTNNYVFTVGTGVNFLSAGVGTETIPYTSGDITGVRVEYKDSGNQTFDSSVVYNDGVQVKILSSGDRYLSTDCALTAHPAQFSFDKMSDGLLLNQTETAYSLNKNDFLDCEGGPGNQKLLVRIEDVTVKGVTYPNAIIWYYLDLQIPYATLNFDGKDTEYDITLPTSEETQSYSVTAFDIYAVDTGQVAGGDVDAASGTLNDAYELVSRVCSQ
jgi:hypothetical protein